MGLPPTHYPHSPLIMSQEEINFSTQEAQQEFADLPEEERQRIVGQQQVEASITHSRVQAEVDRMTLDTELAEIADHTTAQQIRDDIHERVAQEVHNTDEALSAFIDEVRAGVKASSESHGYAFEGADPQYVDFLAAKLGKVPFSFRWNSDDDGPAVTRCVELGSVQDKVLMVGVRKGRGMVELVSVKDMAYYTRPLDATPNTQ